MKHLKIYDANEILKKTFNILIIFKNKKIIIKINFSILFRLIFKFDFFVYFVISINIWFESNFFVEVILLS